MVICCLDGRQLRWTRHWVDTAAFEALKSSDIDFFFRSVLLIDYFFLLEGLGL
jgi:hypothetical protein